MLSAWRQRRLPAPTSSSPSASLCEDNFMFMRWFFLPYVSCCSPITIKTNAHNAKNM